MKLTDKYDGSNDRFEGDRVLTWSGLPAGAKVSKATLTLTPVSATGGVLFQEEIDFNGLQGDWGATKATGNFTDASGTTRAYVEIDFHKRRTLVSVNQSGMVGASLQIDMGGVYVEINSQGAIKTPTDPSAFSLPADGTLPSLTVSKFRLIATAVTNQDVSSVVIRTVPSNINVRLGKMGPFWPRNGDLSATDTSPDFADVLQVYLANAPMVNGFYAVPLTIHSDTIARLHAKLDVTFLQQARLMPDGVSEVVLPFDYSSVPKASPGVLSVDLPPNAQVVPAATTAKVIGAFDDTRIAYGPTGDVSPAGSVTIAPNDSQAEFFALDTVTAAASIDLLIAPQPPGAVLAVDVRADLGGKPNSASLLSTPAQITIPSRPDGQAVWVNIPLAQEVHLQAKYQVPKYWLVVQSLQGQADWAVLQATAGTPVMQHTQDGGLSWRETPAPASASPPAGVFRLRQVPATFQVPIEVQVGAGAQAQRVNLDQYQPLGRVDFDLDLPELSEKFNTYLTKGVSPACSAGEHLANGSLEQWLLTGNNPGNLTSVTGMPAGATTVALAVSADDRNAYAVVLVDAEGGASLVTIDVACNRATGQPLSLPNGLGVRSIRLYPDGSKAWVVGSSQVALIDLQKFRVLGTTLASTSFTIVDLAFSPDGSRVYLTTQTNIVSFDLLALEQAVLSGLLGQGLQSLQTKVNGNVRALAADNTAVYVLSVTGAPPQGTVTFLSPQTLVSDGQPVTVLGSLALAVAPDGSRVLVANSDGTLAIINSQTKDVTTLALGVTSPDSAAIAVDPDSKRAYVATSPDSPGLTIVVVDLPSRSVVQTISVSTTSSITSLAMTPLGDELYIGASNGTDLQYLPIGLRTPADWFITSGRVSLQCLPEISNAHIVAVLAGSSSATSTEQLQPAALSQVAPITGGCTYEFSFEGLSTDANAVAEVLWRGQSCEGVKTDSVPIPLYVAQSSFSSVRGVEAGRFNAVSTKAQVQLIPTSVRLTAPANATAAEVRFTVPDEKAVIASPSLIGGPQGLVNGDLQTSQQTAGTPDSWTLSPTTAIGLLVTATGSQALLRNTGPNTADLVQTAPITAGQTFSLNFTGQATASAAGSDPQIQVRWLDGQGNAIGSALSEDVAPATFNSHPLAGQVPTGATQAEVHISLPSGSSLAVKEISLRQPKTVSVPVSFVAQAPGQLRVSGAQVGYDTAPPAPPSIPATGLCPPTAPGQQPGQQPSGSCHCSCCQSQSTMTNAAAATTPSGRPMTVAQCPTCGNQMVQGGGTVVAAAQPLRVRIVPAPVSAATDVAPAAPLMDVPLTKVVGIGEARAQQLQLAHINTANDLAAADPKVVSQALRGVSANTAEVLIAHAKNLVTNNS
jgi:WD40 repeat protein